LELDSRKKKKQKSVSASGFSYFPESFGVSPLVPFHVKLKNFKDDTTKDQSGEETTNCDVEFQVSGPIKTCF
jgi:hypothetical protein